MLLLSASSAMVSDSEGVLSAKLLIGTATFSTGNAHAFTLYASNAAIRAQSDAPTIGPVRLLNAKELLITSKRGPLSVTVDGETQIIEEGKAYHVYLDPEMAAAQGPSGAGGAQGPSGKGIAAEGGAQPIPDRGGSSDGNRDILCGVGSNGQCRPAIVGRKHEKN